MAQTDSKLPRRLRDFGESGGDMEAMRTFRFSIP